MQETDFNTPDFNTEEFERARPALVGLAYRILGSYAEAEDVVQDTYLAWARADRSEIASARGWLTAVCTRRAIDAARSARLSRTEYVGEWLPELVQTSVAEDTTAPDEPDKHLMMAESLSTAFMVALQRLSAKERAAFILHDVFDTDYREVAKILGVQEPACRKLVSRARGNIRSKPAKSLAPQEHQVALTSAFLKAVETGELAELANLFAKDISFHADGGGKAQAVDKPLLGIEQIIAFFQHVIVPGLADCEVMLTEINAGLGFIVRSEGAIVTTFSFEYTADGKVQTIYAMRNPDKLNGARLPH